MTVIPIPALNTNRHQSTERTSNSQYQGIPGRSSGILQPDAEKRPAEFAQLSTYIEIRMRETLYVADHSIRLAPYSDCGRLEEAQDSRQPGDYHWNRWEPHGPKVAGKSRDVGTIAG
jgi:hypothetical protein